MSAPEGLGPVRNSKQLWRGPPKRRRRIDLRANPDCITLDGQDLRDSSGSFAIFAAMRRSSAWVGCGLTFDKLCIAFFIAARWFLNQSSFEKCSTLESVAERSACYDKLRNDLSRPPVKGPDVPKP